MNVGCIPKKMMHYAGMLAEARKDMSCQGFDVKQHMAHDWDKMISNVQNHVKSINWSYKRSMITKGMDYYNHFATFVDKNTLSLNNGHETI